MSTAAPAPLIFVLEPFGGSTRRHNASLPMVYWDDAAVTRGDGVFETLLIKKGKPANLDRHAKRFLSSAELLELPVPDLEHWKKATFEAAEAWAETTDADGACVWTLTRGRETTGIPSAWMVIKPVKKEVTTQRENGVKVLTCPRGYTVTMNPDSVGGAGSSAASGSTSKGELDGPTTVESVQEAPWITLGAKTLGYAANMAALRHAKHEGFDDVIYVEGDRVLEGATSTVITVRDKKIRTPKAGVDILPGTTQAALFDYASEKGWSCKEKNLTVEDLLKADSVWLLGSVRIATRVTQINDLKLDEPKNAAEVAALVTEALSRT